MVMADATSCHTRQVVQLKATYMSLAVLPSFPRSPAHIQSEKEYYDDLSMELELSDASNIQYKLGEAFFTLSLPAAKKQLRADMKRYDSEIGALEKKADECEMGMKELKVQL
jgi:chaperonin cofactor prefoldin